MLLFAGTAAPRLDTDLRQVRLARSYSQEECEGLYQMKDWPNGRIPMRGLLVNRLKAIPKQRMPSRHFVGLPPELRNGLDWRVMLSYPKFLTIETIPNGQVFLFRFTSEGTPVGDTWHESVDAAIEQARSEYSDALGAWIAVPFGHDALEFALGGGSSG